MHARKTGSWFPIFTANELVLAFGVLVVCAKFGEDPTKIADARVRTDWKTNKQTVEETHFPARRIVYHTYYALAIIIVDFTSGIPC